ncbi:potassium channel family protein [Streptomyces sp. NPDC056773]|uniref:potassium channel family protein n=1 Tax=unclassified Streptomyces TaxID=2593676 RepID=UPI00367EB201
MHDAPETRDQAWERRTELPLLYVSLIFLGSYALAVLTYHSHPLVRAVALGVVALAWACFLVDYVSRLLLSGLHPLRFVRVHWLDTLILMLPILRPLRMVKVHDAIQAKQRRPRGGLYARVMTYAGLSAVLLGFAGALGVYHFERRAPEATIRTFGDAVWWVCETLTTVGYGDVAPVTPAGRTLAAFMMVGGLALLGAVTGSFSSWMLQAFRREDDEEPPGR